MKVSTKSFPHPVLGNEDDVGGEFKLAEFRYELGKEEVVLNPVFSLKNKAIEDLIKKEKASFVVEVECRGTFYRTSFSSRETTSRFVIPANRIRERVTVGFYICADQDIANYRPSESHPDYGSNAFDVEAGDVLGVGGYCSFIAEKSYDPLRPPVSSFMSIREGTFHEGSAQIDYTDDKIAIVLSKSDWKHYADVRGQKVSEGMLHASVVLPVLVDAVYQVRDENGYYIDKNWHSRIAATIEAKGLQDKSAYEVAQKILEYPLDRSFKSIEGLLEVTEDESV